MVTYRAALIASVVVLSALASRAQATELGAESIVHEQAQNQRALAEQRQYLNYHEHFQGMREPHYIPRGELPHHN